MKVEITDDAVLNRITPGLIRVYLKAHGWAEADGDGTWRQPTTTWVYRSRERCETTARERAVEFLWRMALVEHRSQLAVLADVLPDGRNEVLRLVMEALSG